MCIFNPFLFPHPHPSIIIFPHSMKNPARILFNLILNETEYTLNEKLPSNNDTYALSFCCLLLEVSE